MGVAAGIVTLVLLTILWIVAIVVALIALAWPGDRRLRVWILIAVVSSMPVYIAVSLLQGVLEKRRHEQNQALKAVQADQSSAAFHRLCEEPSRIDVKNVVRSAEPVVIAIHEPDIFSPTFMMLPVNPAKKVCWIETGLDGCSRSNISRIQWDYHNRLSCADAPESDRCHPMWEMERAQGVKYKVDRIDAPYRVEVSEPERVDPLIEKFELTVRDVVSSEVLAETHFYRKSWFGGIERKASDANEPRHCPDRDRLVGEMLEKVFPQAGPSM